MAPGSVDDVNDNPLMIENCPLPGHLYPILKVKEVYGQKLINIRKSLRYIIPVGRCMVPQKYFLDT